MTRATARLASMSSVTSTARASSSADAFKGSSTSSLTCMPTWGAHRGPAPDPGATPAGINGRVRWLSAQLVQWVLDLTVLTAEHARSARLHRVGERSGRAGYPGASVRPSCHAPRLTGGAVVVQVEQAAVRHVDVAGVTSMSRPTVTVEDLLLGVPGGPRHAVREMAMEGLTAVEGESGMGRRQHHERAKDPECRCADQHDHCSGRRRPPAKSRPGAPWRHPPIVLSNRCSVPTTRLQRRGTLYMARCRRGRGRPPLGPPLPAERRVRIAVRDAAATSKTVHTRHPHVYTTNIPLRKSCAEHPFMGVAAAGDAGAARGRGHECVAVGSRAARASR